MITYDDDKAKVGIALRVQAGQGDGFKQAKPFFEAGRIIEISNAVFNRLMLDLKSAKGRIGETTKTNGLHKTSLGK